MALLCGSDPEYEMYFSQNVIDIFSIYNKILVPYCQAHSSDH